MTVEEKKPGVYLCEGCGIAEALSLDALDQLAGGDLKVSVCRRHAASCSDDGSAMIAKDIESGGVN